MNAISIISLCFAGIMMILNVTIFIITRVRDTKKDASTNAEGFASLREGILKANLKLDQVCSTMNETRSDIKAMDKKMTEHSEAIAILKRDLETAFIRIDELRDSLRKEIPS